MSWTLEATSPTCILLLQSRAGRVALQGVERESGQSPPPQSTTEHRGVWTSKQGVSREKTLLGHHSESRLGRDELKPELAGAVTRAAGELGQ